MTIEPKYVGQIRELLRAGARTLREIEDALPDLDINDHIQHALTILSRAKEITDRRSKRNVFHFEYVLIATEPVKKTGPIRKTARA